MSLNKKTKINPQLTPYYSLGIQNMLYESLKPKRPAARQHMRQHGKFKKIRSQNPSNDEVFGQFLNIFPEAPKWMFCHPFDVF